MTTRARGVDAEEAGRGSVGDSLKPVCQESANPVIEVNVSRATYREGFCYQVAIPADVDPARFVLFENGRQVGIRNSRHDEIRKLGGGRYSIWGSTLYFSTPQNIDPVSSGHIYELRPAPYYYQIDDLALSPSPWTADITPERANELLAQELADAALRPDFEEISSFKDKVSMLHTDVLVFLRYLAAATSGATIEVGAYIGGSTVMLAKGIRSPRKFIALEMGISHTNHVIPSLDTFSDLVQTVKDQKLAERVTLLKMKSWETGTKSVISGILQKDKISLLLIDSDGQIKRDIEMYRPCFAPGCILVVDDWVDLGYDDLHKADRIKPYITGLVEAGELIPFGVFGWGTWFGRFR